MLTKRLPSGAWPDSTHPASWSTEAYLMAQLIDEIAGLHYTTVRAHGAKPARPKPFPRPKPALPRPQAAPRSSERVSWAALADQLTAAPSPQVVVH